MKTVTRLGGPGFAAGVAAYLLWGLFPLYWPLLEPAAAVEILAHRIVWSLVVRRRRARARRRLPLGATLGRRRALLLAVAAVLITRQLGHVHLRRQQRARGRDLARLLHQPAGDRRARRARARRAAAAGAVGGGRASAPSRSSCSTVDYGRPPWIALALAVLLRRLRAGEEAGGRRRGAEPRVRDGVLLAARRWPTCCGSAASGDGHVHDRGRRAHARCSASGGVVTAVPLMLFGAAAIRVPLTHARPAAVPRADPAVRDRRVRRRRGDAASRLAGFALVWVALIVFTADALRGGRERALVGTVGPGEQGEDGRGATEQQGADHVVEDIDHVPTVARVP